MRHRFALAALCLAVLVALEDGYRVEFTARQSNVGVQVETVCYKPGYNPDNGDQNAKLTFLVVEFVHVNPSDDVIEVRRHNEVPKRDGCWVIGHVKANDNKGDTFFGDPNGDYVIESTKYLRQQ